MTRLELERARARTAIVDEHIRCENRHDLDAMMATFGVVARYDDEPSQPSRYQWPRAACLGRLAAEMPADEYPTTQSVLRQVCRGH